MRNRKFIRIFLGVVATIFLIIFCASLLTGPWIRETIETKLAEQEGDYIVTIDRIRLLHISPGVVLEGINIMSKKDNPQIAALKGEISSARLTGIKLFRAILLKEINIRKVTVTGSKFTGKLPFPLSTGIPVVTPFKIRIGTIIFDKAEVSVLNINNSASYSFKAGFLKFFDVSSEKKDTLSSATIKKFDFNIEELVTIAADSMYSYRVNGLNYRALSGILTIDSIIFLPNYSDYGFTSRHEYQSSRFEGGFSNIQINNFNFSDYIMTGNLVSSFIEVGNLDLKVFRDKRKELRHIDKLEFQDLIYTYPGKVKIDSIYIKNGDIIYAEHAMEANEPGSISFNEIRLKIYKISNDIIYKTKRDTLILKGDALLMGKGRMNVLLKGRIFDSLNTFSLEGTLSNLDADELNPILEKSAFVYITTGRIDSMNFRFTADSEKATGSLTLLYHDLDLTVKNRHTDDTTAFRERFISFIANIKVLNSNPSPGKDVRIGIIDFYRDPERFLLHYCFRAILSGARSSLMKVKGHN